MGKTKKGSGMGMVGEGGGGVKLAKTRLREYGTCTRSWLYGWCDDQKCINRCDIEIAIDTAGREGRGTRSRSLATTNMVGAQQTPTRGREKRVHTDETWR